MGSIAVLLESVGIYELCLNATHLCWATKNIAMYPPRKSEPDDQSQMNNKRPQVRIHYKMCLQTQSLGFMDVQ